MSKKRPRPQSADDTKGLVCGDAELACDTNQPAPRPMKRARSGTSPRGTLNPNVEQRMQQRCIRFVALCQPIEGSRKTSAPIARAAAPSAAEAASLIH